MDMRKLAEILKMTENPKWALRSPDQQEFRTEESPAPVPGQQPKPAGKVPAASIQKYADSLLGVQDNTATNPNAQPGIEGTPQTSLSENIKLRMQNRRDVPFTKPGSITYGGM
jgi:hypothetical protein